MDSLFSAQQLKSGMVSEQNCLCIQLISSVRICRHNEVTMNYKGPSIFKDGK